MTQSRNGVSGESRGTGTLSESEYHRLLSTDRRRHALDVLLDRSAPVDLEALATAVAEREDGLTASDEETIERVMTTLHHVHLPMMDEYDVIAYNVDECHVGSCPAQSELPYY